MESSTCMPTFNAKCNKLLLWILKTKQIEVVFLDLENFKDLKKENKNSWMLRIYKNLSKPDK